MLPHFNLAAHAANRVFRTLGLEPQKLELEAAAPFIALWLACLALTVN